MGNQKNRAKGFGLAWLCLLLVTGAAGSARAGFIPNKDGGIVLIDRALARKHKFPLIINVSGTYRLKESLVNNGTDETLRVITGGVTIDLNGLSLTGSGVENAISITEGLV